MAIDERHTETIPLYISSSTETTEKNKTGSWRFSRPLYQEKTAPCSAACPVGEDIARVELFVAQGRLREAWETIMWENPFPAVCGRVCFHPCEKSCNRGQFDEPIAIRHLERFLGDTGLNERYEFPFLGEAVSRKRIAIIGAGPSGLAAGWFLARLGHDCHVFEARNEPGGLLRFGIPEYRLPADILHREIDRIRDAGVQISCNTPIERSFIEEAMGGHDAVFIGCGHGKALKLNVPGEQLTEDGLAFLRRIRDGEKALAPSKVAVIGGGNTAVDVARSLSRLGGSPVLVYRRQRGDMPAFEEEVEAALGEGVEIMELVAPIGYEKSGNEIELILQKMRPSEQIIGARARVLPIEGKTERLRVRRVFTAIGNEAAAPWMLPSHFDEDSLKFHHLHLLNREIPIAHGGDLANPVKSVTDAIASGKAAAMAFDTLFSHGWEQIEKRLSACVTGVGPALSMRKYAGEQNRAVNAHIVSFSEINSDYFEPEKRIRPKQIVLGRGDNRFAQLEQTLFTSAAMNEAMRCFHCGICNDCDNCRLFCPELAVVGQSVRKIDMDYCKGCGICVVECPRNAMALEEEKS